MSEQEVELATSKVVLRKDGSLVLPKADGDKDLVVARYNKATGNLEFATREFSTKYYAQVVSRIGSVAKGTQPSGNQIRTISIEGGAPHKIEKDAPPRPRMSKLGDCTPAVVEWFFRYDLPQAIIRYGVYTDADGNPVRAKCRRIVKAIVDRRDLDDRDLTPQRSGPKSEIKGPIAEESELIEQSDGIVARRPTVLTFTPKEVVGGFDTGEDDMLETVEGEE